MVAVSLKKKFFQAEDGIRDLRLSRGLGDVYKRQEKEKKEGEEEKEEEEEEEEEETTRKGLWQHQPTAVSQNPCGQLQLKFLPRGPSRTSLTFFLFLN